MIQSRVYTLSLYFADHYLINHHILIKSGNSTRPCSHWNLEIFRMFPDGHRTKYSAVMLMNPWDSLGPKDRAALPMDPVPITSYCWLCWSSNKQHRQHLWLIVLHQHPWSDAVPRLNICLKLSEAKRCRYFTLTVGLGMWPVSVGKSPLTIFSLV